MQSPQNRFHHFPNSCLPIRRWPFGEKLWKNIQYFAVVIGGIKQENLHYLSRDFSQDFLDIYKRLITSKTHLYNIPQMLNYEVIVLGVEYSLKNDNVGTAVESGRGST